MGQDVLGVATEDVREEPPGFAQPAVFQVSLAQQAVAFDVARIIAQHILADGDGAIDLARLQRLFGSIVCFL
jgi:hypothetical protein